jgi:hypothetical protein
MSTEQNTIEELANREYKYGFVTDIEADASGSSPPGSKNRSGFWNGASRPTGTGSR